MLVVRRIHVGEVAMWKAGRHFKGVPPDGHAGARDQLGEPELERPKGSGSPALQVRHLQPGGGIHPVGSFEQARQEQGVEGSPRVGGLDLVSDGIYPQCGDEAAFRADVLDHPAISCPLWRR